MRTASKIPQIRVYKLIAGKESEKTPDTRVRGYD